MKKYDMKRTMNGSSMQANTESRVVRRKYHLHCQVVLQSSKKRIRQDLLELHCQHLLQYSPGRWTSIMVIPRYNMLSIENWPTYNLYVTGNYWWRNETTGNGKTLVLSIAAVYEV